MRDRTAEIGNGQGPTPQYFEERRKYTRFATCAVPAKVQIDEKPEWLTAHVVDVSTAGIRLSLAECLPEGACITVRFNDIIAIGQVRYTQPARDVFYVGVQLKDALRVV